MKVEHLLEAGLARINDKMKNHSVGIISAFRSEYPFKENMKRHLEMKERIRAMGYQVIAVKGSYIENFGSEDEIEVDEKSLFVVSDVEGDDDGKLEKDLRRLASYYDQDAVLSKRYEGKAFIIGTRNSPAAFPSFNEYVLLGDPKLGKANMFFSKIRNRPFTFESTS